MSRLTVPQLEQLEEILTIISTAVKNVNEMLADSAKCSMDSAALASMSYMNALPEKKSETKLGKALNTALIWNNLQPVDAFARFGEGGNEVFRNICRGWGRFSLYAKGIEAFTTELFSAEEAQRWESETHTFELETRNETKNGELRKKASVTMTTAQLMELYALMRRQTNGLMQAQEHIYSGGIRIANYQEGKKTKLQARDYFVTPESWAEMLKELKKDEKAFKVINELQTYMNTVGTRWGNEVSMRRWGIRAFTDINYWPIHTDPNLRQDSHIESEDSTSLYRLLNMSFTKSTVRHANGAIVIGSALEAFANHMTDMAKYNALGLPMLDALKWYNWTDADPENAHSVKGIMEKTYGVEAKQWFKQFIADLNGVKEGGYGSQGERALNALTRNFKVAAVGANLRVVIQQPTSIARAASLINPKYIAKGIFTEEAYEEMLKYSDFATWKLELGYYDININRSLRDRIMSRTDTAESLREKSLWLAGEGDRIAWTAMWNACRAEIAATQKLKGNAMLRATGRRFDEVMLKTQVIDSTITRSQIMRNQSLGAATFTAFMSEPIMSFNNLLRAAMAYDTAKKQKLGAEALRQATGQMARSTVVFAVNAALTSAAAALIDMARDDDDYESMLEKWLEHFEDNFKDNINPLGLVPYVKQIYELFANVAKSLKSGKFSFSFGSVYGDVLTDLGESIVTAVKYLQRDTESAATYYGRMTSFGMAQKLLTAVGELAGLPFGAAARELRGTVNFVITVWNATVGKQDGKALEHWKTYDPGKMGSIKNAYEDGYLTEDEAAEELVKSGEAESLNEAYLTVIVWDTGSKYAMVKEAVEAQDIEAFEAACRILESHGVKHESIQAEARNCIRDLYTGTETENASIGRKEATGLLIGYAGCSAEQADTYVTKWSMKKETGMSADNIKEEFMDGNLTEKEAAEALVNYMGKTEKEAKYILLKYSFEAETGVSYDELGQAYIDGRLTKAETIKALKKIDGLSDYDANERITGYDFKKKHGYSTDEIKASFIKGEIGRTEVISVMTELGRENPEQIADDYEFEKKHGFDPNEVSSLYFKGNINAAQVRTAFEYKGLDEDEIQAQFDRFDFVKDAPGTTNITVQAVAAYKSNGLSMDKTAYYEAWKACNTMEGEDLNGDGRIDTYSAADKKLAHIDSLSISKDEKTRLALAFGISQKTINKRAPWNG